MEKQAVYPKIDNNKWKGIMIHDKHEWNNDTFQVNNI